MLQPFLLRRVREDVASELPKITEHVIKTDLSGWQK
jgi:SNF2 family DNA or RNA helicase